MDHPQITHVSLCAGYGGIDLGLHRCIPNLRTIAYAEIEAFACELLLARMEGGQIDAAPIWPDLKSLPWGKLRDRVDILSGGYPCQPFSSAGKRLGREDPRHLWPYIADGISILRPRLCYFENVEGHISLGLREVVEHLGELGYSATWGIFSAAECGAPHQRKRVFILAHRLDSGLEGFRRAIKDGIKPGRINQETGGSTGAGGVWRRVSFAGNCEGGSEDELGDTCSVCGGEYVECECPGPTQEGYEYEEIGGELYARLSSVWPSRPGQPQFGWEPPRVVGNAASTEWRADDFWGEGQTIKTSGAFAAPDGRPTQPALGRNADGPPGRLDYAQLCVAGDSRVDELRLLGNGVVPAVAERAFRVLLTQLNDDLRPTVTRGPA